MTDELEILETSPQRAAVIHLTIPRTEMQEAFPSAIHEILGALEEQGMAPAGPPYARHFRLHPETFDFEVGFPIDGAVEPRGRVEPGELPAARVVQTIHRGAYEGLPGAWRAFHGEIRARELPVGDEFRERYVVGPEAGPDPEGWRTELSWVLG